MKSMKMFKMVNGEMVITAVTDVTEDGLYVLDFPAIVMPVPPERAGGQNNQVGFGKYLPFSNYDEEILMNPECIAVESTPSAHMEQTYDQWTTQVKAAESGIVMANQVPKMRDGEARDFTQLNT